MFGRERSCRNYPLRYESGTTSGWTCTARPWPDYCTNLIGEALVLWRKTETKLVRFASRSSTRRTPEDFCSDRNRGKPTWFAGDWESRGDTGGPSMTYPTADVMAGVGCPRLDARGLVRRSGVAVLRVCRGSFRQDLSETGSRRRCAFSRICSKQSNRKTAVTNGLTHLHLSPRSSSRSRQKVTFSAGTALPASIATAVARLLLPQLPHVGPTPSSQTCRQIGEVPVPSPCTAHRDTSIVRTRLW